MQFTELFIRKPVLSLVLSFLILLVGIKSFSLLSVREYPAISPSVITVETAYPGAPSQLMEGFVTTPLENALGSIEGVDVIHSASRQGSSQITLQFKLGYSLEKAMSNVSNAVASVRKQLPQAVLDPIIDTRDPNADPTLFISFSSKALSLPAITDYLTRIILPQLQSIPGVSQAQIFGNNDYAMRLWLDPKKMAAHQVTASDIINALNQNNVQAAPGMLQSTWQTINISANTDMTTAAQFNNLIIRKENGYLVRLSDVGHAVLGIQSDQASASVNGNKQAAIIGIVPLATANPLTVATAVKALLPQLQANAPNNIKVDLIWDSAKFISESIHDVKRTFFEAGLFVFVVIFLFLGTLRATLIPLITIPLSILGVCAAMLVLGYSLNVLTLLAWVLAIGLVVDDAIVVLENIHRHSEQGLSFFNAAIVGTKEIGFAIVAMTLTLAAVYAPIGFLNDMTGILFREFAFTLAAAVVISGFVALTLSPMMCSKLLKHETKSSAFMLKIDSLFNGLAITYRKSLVLALQHRKVILGLTAIIYLACFGLYKSLSSELAPQEDQGIVITAATGPTSANLPYMEKYIAQIQAIYKTMPEVTAYVMLTGMPTLNSGLSFLVLKPWNERHASSEKLIQSLFKRYWGITGLQAFPFAPPALPGSTGHAPLMFVLKTTESYTTLDALAKKLQRAVAQHNPHILGLQSNLKMDLSQVNIDIDKNKAISLGISMEAIANSLNILIGQPQGSVFNWNGRSYQVIPQLYHRFMSTADQLKDINVRSQSGELIPLANVVSLHNSVTAQNLNHFQQLRSVTLSANLAPGYTVGEAVNYLEQLSKKILPNTVQIDFSGETRQFMQAGNSMKQTFLFAIIFIFLVLAAQFESFLAPFIILLTVPLSLTGALLALRLTGGSLNIYTQIGLVTLIGLITKHGILIVEFAKQLQKKQKLLTKEAIIEAASLRLRPILMTTATMLLAAVPLAFANGVGAHARSQLGWVIFGGMAIGTFFTLFILPVMYSVVYSKRSSP
ncbi:MAG: efflux RND transporter permease subunit [Pseudomonadota bacterium]